MFEDRYIAVVSVTGLSKASLATTLTVDDRLWPLGCWDWLL